MSAWVEHRQQEQCSKVFCFFLNVRKQDIYCARPEQKLFSLSAPVSSHQNGRCGKKKRDSFQLTLTCWEQLRGGHFKTDTADDRETHSNNSKSLARVIFLSTFGLTITLLATADKDMTEWRTNTAGCLEGTSCSRCKWSGPFTVSYLVLLSGHAGK